MSRSIAVFTSSRADAGPLGPVVEALDASADFRLVLIASGAHLDPKRGRTIDGLCVSKGSAMEIVDAGLTGDDPRSLIEAYGPLARGVADVLARHKVDILLVLGDRWELLPVAGAAVMLQVPVAHLHGGEVTEGALDERVRHAVTKLADLHFCATEEYRQRIVQMGEEPWRVHVTGAPALDRFSGVVSEDASSLGARLGIPLSAPWGVVTYHPPTVDRDRVRERARAVFEAAAKGLAAVVITYPGLDPGADVIIEEIERITTELENVYGVPNLGNDYATVLASADVMVGNSSSGVIEAATFRLPVVNVGDRQLGRIAPANVLQCDEDPGSIGAALGRALDPEFRAGLDGLVNPYGDGRATERIIEVLIDAPAERLARKRFVDSGRA